jgi:hypothetical protein
MALRQLGFGRDFGRDTIGHTNPAPKVSKPRIISKAEWGGGESSGTMKRHFPVRLTIHHEGSAKPLTLDKDPRQLLQNLQKWGWREKGWADIPYHYLIDLSGNIYEARDPLAAGDTSTTYDPTGHLLVSVMGNYEIQAPNELQLDAMCNLLAWLSDYYNVSPETLAGHMEYYDYTACPGKYLAPYVMSGFLEGEVRKRLRSAYHGLPASDEQTSATATPNPGKPAAAK